MIPPTSPLAPPPVMRTAPPQVLIPPRRIPGTTEILEDFPHLMRWSALVNAPGQVEPFLFTLVACLRLAWQASHEARDPSWGVVRFGPVCIAFRFDW